MKNYLTELIGTFFLVLTVLLTGDPIAIGTALMVMVYMGGHISGGHYNPAVTFSVLIRGKIESGEAIKYMIYQLAGAVLAALIAWWLLGETHAAAPGANANVWQALGVEIIFTFALCLVVLNTATADETQGNSYFGLAIGFTVLMGAYAGGSISGGAFNPAVGTGPLLVSMFNGGDIAHVWLYLVGPFAGGWLAAVVFKMQHA